MPKRPTRQVVPPTAAATLDPNGPKIRRSRLDRFTAQPEDIEFITVTEAEVVNHPPSEDDEAESTTPSSEPQAKTPKGRTRPRHANTAPQPGRRTRA